MTYSLLEQSLIETWLLLTALHFKVVIIPPHRYQCGKIKTESPCYNCLPLEVRVEDRACDVSRSAAASFPNYRRNSGEFFRLPALCPPTALPSCDEHKSGKLPAT